MAEFVSEASLEFRCVSTDGDVAFSWVERDAIEDAPVCGGVIGGLVIELQLTSPCPRLPFVIFNAWAGIATRQLELAALGLIIAGTVNPFVYGEVINITDSSVGCIAVDDVANDAGDAAIFDCSIIFE